MAGVILLALVGASHLALIDAAMRRAPPGSADLRPASTGHRHLPWRVALTTPAEPAPLTPPRIDAPPPSRATRRAPAAAPPAPVTTRAAPEAAAPAPAEGHWPRYATRPPPSRTLHFSVSRGDEQGEGRWEWQHDGQRFQSTLSAELAGRRLIEQHSLGGFDEHGLAPERGLERQARGAPRAVNFQRERGWLSFSGRPEAWALPDGAQDRLSWLPQLLAVLAAQPHWTVGATLRLPVAGADGDLGAWDWTLIDTDALDGQPALHWQRPARRPYDHRIDLWLEAEAPHWPLAWQWLRTPGGTAVRWSRQTLGALNSTPGPPPALPGGLPPSDNRP